MHCLLLGASLADIYHSWMTLQKTTQNKNPNTKQTKNQPPKPANPKPTHTFAVYAFIPALKQAHFWSSLAGWNTSKKKVILKQKKILAPVWSFGMSETSNIAA